MMNKFNGPEDPDYQCVIGKIEEILQEIRTNSPLDDADAWIRNKHYAADRLKIERLSGDLLPMDQCYINLAVVEQRGQDSDQSMTEDAKSSPFSIFNRQKIETPDTTVPLRNLKLEERRQHPAYDFEALLTHEYFSLPNNKPYFAKHLAQTLESSSSRTLFLLDGLDEVSQELAGSNSMSRFLNELLEQPNIIATSRPSGRLPLNLDLELEAVGFYPDQVKNYIEKTFTNPKTTELDEKKVDKIQSFLQGHWLIQGLVRIPIQLDALCYSWKDIRTDMPKTMTALYQAIELSLWKKDIMRQQKIEEFVKDEISFLEGLAFAGLLGDTIEFEPKHLNLISDRFPGFFDHFIHLTFQEYFAARYFVRQWTARENLSYVELGSRKIGQIEPAEFFQKNKYTARYNILWRFVAGLLDAEPEEISLFFQKIEDEPLDLLGPAHQRLVMHCLSEVSSDLPVRTSLEERLSKWLLFECEITQDDCSHLASEVEFPEQALATAFGQGWDTAREKILGAITKRATVPASIIDQTIFWLGHTNYMAEGTPIWTLMRLALPNWLLEIVAARLEDENMYVRDITLHVLGQQSILPKEILEAMAARLDDEHIWTQKSAIISLGRQSVLSERILKAIAARLEDKDPSVRQVTAGALGRRFALSGVLLKAVIARLEDEHPDVREFTVQALRQQSTLPDEILEAIAARLEDNDQSVREAAFEALNQHLSLSNEALKTIATQLEDNENRSARVAAINALSNQSNLPYEVFEAVAKELKDKENLFVQVVTLGALGTLQVIAASLEDNENSAIQVAAINTLGKQSSIPNGILRALEAYLKGNKDNSLLRKFAMSSLGTQSSLSNTILHAVVAQLNDNGSAIQYAARDTLTKQSSLPDEIINAIAALLEINDRCLQGSAIVALGSQPGLSDKILDAIAQQYTDIYKINAKNAIVALDNQSNLPNKYLDIIAAQLGNDAFSAKFAESALRKRRKFYLTLFEGPYAPSLYKVLLRQSFKEDLTWCVDDDGNSFINMPGDGGRIVIGKQDDVKAIIKGLRPANYPT
ncbi:hypothetical protein MKX08_001431 [Trichoderma sp. CBMAI-0020]|nr:hypothetical protein MKX08_001431 [Trichoderma sp. CBMAI-0020]